MWLKKIIILCCFLGLSLQVLPIVHLSRCMFANKPLQELKQDDTDAAKDDNGIDNFKKDFLVSDYDASCLFQSNVSISFIHFHTILPPFLASEIHTPPPDVC